jgi:hypothetical protein
MTQQPSPNPIIHLLMENQTIVSAYQDKALAHHDCWLCNEAEKFSPDPMPYWVKEVEFITEIFSESEFVGI